MKSIIKGFFNKLKSKFRSNEFNSENETEKENFSYKQNGSNSSLNLCNNLKSKKNKKSFELSSSCLNNKHQTVVRCASENCSPCRPINQKDKKFFSTKSKPNQSFLNQSVNSLCVLNENKFKETSKKKVFNNRDLNGSVFKTDSLNVSYHDFSSISVKAKSSSNINYNQESVLVRNISSSKTSLGQSNSSTNSNLLLNFKETVSELPVLVFDDTDLNLKSSQKPICQKKDLNEVDSLISGSLPNFNTYLISDQTSENNYSSIHPSNNQSASFDKNDPNQSDLESLISFEMDMLKGSRSKSVDATIAMSLAKQNSSSLANNQRPRGSTPFLEIPKWRLFVRKPSQSSTSVTVNKNNTNSNVNLNLPNPTQSDNLNSASNWKLTDIFKDCVHCKNIVLLGPKAFMNDINLSNASLEEEDEEYEENEDLDTEAEDIDFEDNQLSSKGETVNTTNFFNNDFSSTAVYHQQNYQNNILFSNNSSARRYVKNRIRRSSYNVTYYSKHSNSNAFKINLLNNSPTIKENNNLENENEFAKQPVFHLPSVTLSETFDDEQNSEKNCAISDLVDSVNNFSFNKPFINIEITEPCSSCDKELDDPGSGITVVSLEVPVLNTGKQARSASVDSSFLQVPQRSDIGNCELPPTKSVRSRSVDIALPEGPDGPYLVVPSINQRPVTTK